MLLSLKRKAQRAAAGQDDRAAASQASARMVEGLAHQAADVGRYGAEVHAVVEDVSAQCKRNAAQMRSLAGEIDAVVGVHRRDREHRRQRAGSDARRARSGRARGRRRVGGDRTLGQVSGAAQEITQIALQTRLVAFNATVEAKRAGEAGLGFAVVAEAVKELATKVGQSSTLIMTTVEQLDRRIAELAAEITNRSAGRATVRSRRRWRRPNAAWPHIAAAAQGNLNACRSAAERGVRSSPVRTDMARALETARDAPTIPEIAESLIELTARSGCQTEDTPYIACTLEAAARIGDCSERGTQRRDHRDDLFDEQYRRCRDRSPAVHDPVHAFTDRVLPRIRGPLLRLSTKVVYLSRSIATAICRRTTEVLQTAGRRPGVERGQLPQSPHLRRSHRSGGAGTERQFLLQIYRRDMGGGEFAMMKDLSAPIVVARAALGRASAGLHLLMPDPPRQLAASASPDVVRRIRLQAASIRRDASEGMPEPERP